MVKKLFIISFISVIMMSCVNVTYEVNQDDVKKRYTQDFEAEYKQYENCLLRGDRSCACKLAELYWRTLPHLLGLSGKSQYEKAKWYFEKCYKDKMVNQSIDWEKIDPKHIGLGAGIYYKLGDYKKALEAILVFRKFRTPNSGEFFLFREKLYYYYLVDCYVKTQQWDLAIENGRKLMSLYINPVFESDVHYPGYGEALNIVGLAYHGAKLYNEAISTYKKALELRPNDAIYLSNLADCYYELKQYTEALLIYNRALLINPKHLHPYFQIANIYYTLGDYENAIATLEKAQGIEPNNYYIHCDIGYYYAQFGRFDDAIASLNKAIELSIISGIGVSIGIEDYPVIKEVRKESPAMKAGIETGDKIIKVNGESTEHWGSIEVSQALRGPEGTFVTLLIERKGISKPIEKKVERTKILTKATAGPLGFRSLIYALKGDFEKALKDAEMAYSLDPNNLNAKNALALSYIAITPPLTKEGKIKESINILSTIKDDNFSRLLEALAYSKMGDFKKSAEIYASIPQEYLLSKSVFRQRFKNIVLESLMPYFKHKQNTAKSLETKGLYREALNEYVEALRIADGDQAKEIRSQIASLIKKAPYLSEIPEEARKYAIRGEAMLEEGKLKEALKEFNTAIKIAPHIAIFYRTRALIYGELKDYSNAISSMNAYLELMPDAPDTRAAKDKIYKWEFLMEKEKGEK